MKYRTRAQIAEILGDDNRWFCSQHHRREITDPETLARYFCASGGADDFRNRWNEAMGPTNRWFCSERHGYDVTDEETLWCYYMAQQLAACAQAISRSDAAAELRFT